MRWSLVAATLFLTLAVAAPARAGTATLWACHGPAGGALGAGPIQTTGPVSGGCDAPGTMLRAATFALDVPAGTTLSAVRISRRAVGPGYVAKADATELEREDAGAVLDGELAKSATGSGVRLSGGTIDLRYAALTVTDETAPAVAVGGLRNPAQGVLVLDVRATDNGVGLATVSATLDGTPVGGDTFGTCAELSPADATSDRALGADCPGVGQATARVDTTRVPDGEHELRVTVTDAAGNGTSPPLWAFEVLNHVDPGSPTGTIEIGTGGPTATPTPTATATASPAPQPAAVTTTPTPVVQVTTQAATPRPLTTRQRVRIPSKLKVAKNGTVSFSVLCPAASAAPCALRLKLAQGRTTIASGRGTAKPGKRATLRLRLSKRALRTLARRHKLDATLTLAGAAPATVHLRQ